MENASVEKFFSLVKLDPQLTERLRVATTADQFAQLAAEMAGELGLAITASEFTATVGKLKASGATELTDEELHSVAGGFGFITRCGNGVGPQSAITAKGTVSSGC
jgi:hypothetical protein